MTIFQIIVGWIGALLFFGACWLMGSKSQSDRKDGTLGFVCVNLCFGIQAMGTGNWSLLVMSAGGAALQLRVWMNWDRYDGR